MKLSFGVILMGHPQRGQSAERRLTESRMKQKHCRGRKSCSKREEGNRIVVQKQIDCQIFLHQKRGRAVSSGSAENCNLGSVGHELE